MPLDISELNSIEKLVRDDFAKAFAEQHVTYPKFVSQINDSELITVFEWLGAFPRVREWVGSRHMEDLENYDYIIRNKYWEVTIKVPYRKIWEKSNTKLGSLVINQVQALGASFRKDYPANLIFQALENGTTNKAYDDVPFFANPTGNRLIDNLLLGNGTTVDNITMDIAESRSAAKRFTDSQGRTLNITLDTAVIPPELETKFQEIVKTKMRDAGDNINYGSLDYIVDGRLTDSNDWYFLATGEFVKPFIFVNIDGVNVSIKDTMFDNKSISIGADAMGNVGYSFPHLAVKIVNS